jgi:hypothetical protein
LRGKDLDTGRRGDPLRASTGGERKEEKKGYGGAGCVQEGCSFGMMRACNPPRFAATGVVGV